MRSQPERMRVPVRTIAGYGRFGAASLATSPATKPGPSHNQIAKKKVRASVCKWGCLRRGPRELEQGGRADRVTDRAAATGRCELSVVPVLTLMSAIFVD